MGAVCGCSRATAVSSEHDTWSTLSEIPSTTEISTPDSAEASRNNKRVEEARRARVEWLETLRRECATEEEFQTARTQPIWTQVDTSSCSSSCVSEDPSPAALQRIHEENRLHFQHLVVSQGPIQKLRKVGSTPFYVDFGERLEAGQKIGGGGQANVHEAIYNGRVLDWCVLKVFGRNWLLADLQHTWTKGIVKSFSQSEFYDERYGNSCSIKHGVQLQDGRFAFVLQRCWGDLRKAIDLEIVKDKTHQQPPFSKTTTIHILMQIALGMRRLYKMGILHRDLKASNCLLLEDPKYMIPSEIICLLGDYESSLGVVGTRFWRAPEVLLALKNKERDINSLQEIWTEEADVYSYAMTCYEVLTGCIPFEDRPIYDYDGVIGGEMPSLPDYVDPTFKVLIRSYWHSKPSMRPPFYEVIHMIKNSFPQIFKSNVVYPPGGNRVL